MTTTVLRQPQTSFLKNALLANAVFSSVSGLSFIMFTQAFSRFLSWSSWILPSVGLGLLGFALMIYLITRAEQINYAQVRSIIAADVAWVVLSIALISMPVVSLPLGGKWAIGILADVVAVFALLQYLGLRKHKS